MIASLPKLSPFLLDILANNPEIGGLTDIYISSGQPVAVRNSSFDWTIPKDEDGEPFVFPRESIIAFVNAIFIGKEEVPREEERWQIALRKTGSLHPSTVLSGTNGNGDTEIFRVRCTIKRQRMGTGLGLVVRCLLQTPPALSDLGLPETLRADVMKMNNGLVVVTGPTGSGKTTTIMAMLEIINQEKTAHILTIEDPIEYELLPNKSIVSQREIGVDVPNFAHGVKDALRFVPDVMLVGETRDAETMKACVRAGESGHLVFTSMHSPTTTGALLKIRALLEEADRGTLTSCIQMVISHALVKSESTGRNVLLYEVLPCNDPSVRQALVSGNMKDIEVVKSRLSNGQIRQGVSWQHRLRSLVGSGVITARQGMYLAQNDDDRNEFASQARLAPPASV